MSSLYLDKWEKKLDRTFALITVIIAVVFFIAYEYTVISRLLADTYGRRGRIAVAKGRALADNLLVEKSLLYQQGLRLFKRSITLNSFSAIPYFEYAEALVEIAGMPLVRKSMDPGYLDPDDLREEEFYNKAARFYRKALLRDPFNSIYHQRLGDVYLRLSDITLAEKEFACAAMLDSNNVSLHVYLAQYYSSRKEEVKFKYHLDRIVFLYNASLRGGGPLSNMVRMYLKHIHQEELIK